MTPSLLRDCSLVEWAASPFVEALASGSLIKEGFLNVELYVPVAADRRACLAVHRLFAEWKYADLFGQASFLDALRRPKESIADGIVLTAPGNHWHFLMDGLANLDAALLARYAVVYVDRNLSDDQIGFLKVFAKAVANTDITVRRLEHANYALKNVLVPTNKPFAAKVSNLRDGLARIDARPRDPDASKRLYVTRRNAGTRRLLNEDALLGRLESEFGFRLVENENHSLLDQLRLYRNATVVMGPHGAGLTNVVFARRPELLVEMFHSFQQPFFAMLSQSLGGRYLGIKGRVAASARADPYSDREPFRVDVDGLIRALRQILVP